MGLFSCSWYVPTAGGMGTLFYAASSPVPSLREAPSLCMHDGGGRKRKHSETYTESSSFCPEATRVTRPHISLAKASYRATSDFKEEGERTLYCEPREELELLAEEDEGFPLR